MFMWFIVLLLFICVMLMVSVVNISGVMIILIRCRNILDSNDMYLVIFFVIFGLGNVLW